jgi:hypothetical protein
MTRRQVLAAAVLAHLAISLAHGRAHLGANVPLPLGSTIFVYVVIMAGPLVGLALSFRMPRAGAWLVAASMTGSLVFGLINHFVIAGPDQVSHVAAAWRPLFSWTAALLVVSEAAGSAVGVWVGAQGQSSRSELKVGA